MAHDVSREELTEAFNRAIDQQGAAESAHAEAMSGDAKTFFCDNWPMIKEVLRMLGQKIGGIGGIAVKGLLAAGDHMHTKTCR